MGTKADIASGADVLFLLLENNGGCETLEDRLEGHRQSYITKTEDIAK